MLSWQFQPDEAFAAILDSSLSSSIEWLSDHLAGKIDEGEVVSLFRTRIWELFERRKLLTELQKLQMAHRSAKLSMPTDYHFLIHHEVLQLQISLHNVQVASGGQPLAFGSVLLTLVQGLKPHPKELELKEVEAEIESPINHYKRGECYPHIEEQLE